MYRGVVLDPINDHQLDTVMKAFQKHKEKLSSVFITLTDDKLTIYGRPKDLFMLGVFVGEIL